MDYSFTISEVTVKDRALDTRTATAVVTFRSPVPEPVRVRAIDRFFKAVTSAGVTPRPQLSLKANHRNAFIEGVTPENLKQIVDTLKSAIDSEVVDYNTRVAAEKVLDDAFAQAVSSLAVAA